MGLSMLWIAFNGAPIGVGAFPSAAGRSIYLAQVKIGPGVVGLQFRRPPECRLGGRPLLCRLMNLAEIQVCFEAERLQSKRFATGFESLVKFAERSIGVSQIASEGRFIRAKDDRAFDQFDRAGGRRADGPRLRVNASRRSASAESPGSWHIRIRPNRAFQPDGGRGHRQIAALQSFLDPIRVSLRLIDFEAGKASFGAPQNNPIFQFSRRVFYSLTSVSIKIYGKT